RHGAVAHFVPQRLRNVDAARGRTLLPLVLVPTAHDRGGHRRRIGRGVRDDEVLAAGLADQTRIRLVAADVLADRLPHRLEHTGTAGEVDAREVGTGEQDVGDLARVARHEV